MDPLDDALADLRIAGSVVLHECYRADWAIAVPDEPELRRLFGAGPGTRVLPFHLVRQGGFTLHSGEVSVRLGTLDVSLVAGGAAHVLTVGHPRRAVPLAEILRGEGMATAAATEPGVTELVCGVFTARAAPLSPLLGALPPVLALPAGPGAAPTLARVAEMLGAALGQPRRNDFTTQRLLEMLCAEVIRAHRVAQAAAAPGWFAGLSDAKVAAALGRIHAAPAEAWSVEALAGGVALSPSRFAARFRAAMGESVMGYVGRWRANLACRLLEETDLPLPEIGLRVGYESLAAFSRAFKAQAGVPPARWRAGERMFPGPVAR